MVLYRSTLMAKSVKTELGTVMRYTVSQVMHKAFQCFHSPCRKRASTSNSASRVTVRRSEMARSTLMAKSVKTELGTVMRYTVSQVMHKAFQCFHSPCRKRASTSNSASRVTVRRSEMARDNSKRFVGLSRSSLLASMA